MTVPEICRPAPVKGDPSVCRDGRRTPSISHGERFFSFICIGVFSTLLDAALLAILTEYCGIWYLWSSAASYCCGILVSYALNRHYTFHDRSKKYLSRFFLFALISVSSLAINLVVMFVAVDFFSLHYLAGKGMAIGVSFFWNYMGQSRITFQD
jgi:putative flippase GtrA